MKTLGMLVLSLGLILLAWTSGLAEDSKTLSAKPVLNPFSPRFGHVYRHGAVPTRTAHEKMRTWINSKAALKADMPVPTGDETLSYGGT